MENVNTPTMFKCYSTQDRHQWFTPRAGENKLGETIIFPDESASIESALAAFTGQYVLLGIPEDIGPRANHGKAGARNTWTAALKSFCNVQANDYLKGDDLLILGHVFTDDLLAQADAAASPEALGPLVEQLDQRVSHVLQVVFANGKTPIIIGGGHNNVYPILHALHQYLRLETAVINLDPHCDLRDTDYRHSGNGFSFALEQKILDKYAIVGMQEGYNNQHILNTLKNKRHVVFKKTFESLLDKPISTKKLVKELKHFTGTSRVGLELDMDLITNCGSSAMTPSGMSEFLVRRWVRRIAKQIKPVYFHISEAIVSENSLEGKLIAYFVQDFIKCHNS